MLYFSHAKNAGKALINRLIVVEPIVMSDYDGFFADPSLSKSLTCLRCARAAAGSLCTCVNREHPPMGKPTLTNGFDSALVQGYLTEIDDADTRLATLQSDYMNKCKGPRGDIAAIFEASKEAGIPQRAFKALVKNRRLNNQINRNAARLEADDADAYERLVEGLGDFVDLPLGQAAVRRARPAESVLTGLNA
jgi:hypothetical protein